MPADPVHEFLPIGSAAAAAWSDYLAAEKLAIRKLFLGKLSVFLERLDELAPAERTAFAVRLAAAVVDDGDKIPLRHPLFTRIVFPELRSGYEAREPGHARWLAGMTHHFYRNHELWRQLPGDWPGSRELLEAAVELDPTDRPAAASLLGVLRETLKYTLHEVPSGVLFGPDGATPGECVTLRDDLHRFEALRQSLDDRGDVDWLTDACRLHFREWPRFLADRERFGTYEAYLESKFGADSIWAAPPRDPEILAWYRRKYPEVEPAAGAEDVDAPST